MRKKLWITRGEKLDNFGEYGLKADSHQRRTEPELRRVLRKNRKLNYWKRVLLY